MFQWNETMQINKIEPDNAVLELLEIVIEFTYRRGDLLRKNIAGVTNVGFVAYEYPVKEFVDMIEKAVAEQIYAERILLEDSEYVKFGENGSFEVYPTVDQASNEIFKKDINAYIDLQKEKLAENRWLLTQARNLLNELQTVAVPLAV